MTIGTEEYRTEHSIRSYLMKQTIKTLSQRSVMGKFWTIALLLCCLNEGVLAGSLAFSPGVFTVSENVGTFTVTVMRSGSTSAPATVKVVSGDSTAVAGSDFTAVSQDLSWGIGDSVAKTVTITITDDSLVEGSEVFLLKLSNPTGDGTGGDAVITITDFETGKLQFSSPTFFGDENNLQIMAKIDRVSGTDGPASVKIKSSVPSSSGASIVSDYIPLDKTVTFASGESTKDIPISLKNDDIAELSEYLKVTLSDPSGAILGATQAADIEIQDSDEEWTSTLKLLTKTEKNIEQSKLVDLSQESLLDPTKKIIDLLNEIPILTLTELSAEQDTDGLMTIDVESDKVFLRPVAVKRARNGALPEVNVRDDISAVFITSQGWLLETQPALAKSGLSVLQKKLAEIFLPELVIADTGNITVQVDQGAPPFERDSANNVIVNYKFYDRWNLRPSMVSTVSSSSEEGYRLIPHPIDGDQVMMAVTYKEGANFRQQILSSAPINGVELTQELTKNGINRCPLTPGATGCKVAVTNPKQLNNGIVTFDIDSIVAATGKKQTLKITLFADYRIRKTPKFTSMMIGFTEMPDLNRDSFGDYKMIYANGEEQYFFFVSSLLK